MNLRSKLIRLAHAQPDLRPHLLPLLSRTAEDGWDVSAELRRSLTDLRAARVLMGQMNNMTPFSNYYKGEHGRVRTALIKAATATYNLAKAEGNLPLAQLIRNYLGEVKAKRSGSAGYELTDYFKAQGISG